MHNIYISLDLRAKISEEHLHYHVDRITNIFKKRFAHIRVGQRPILAIELLQTPVCYVEIKSSQEISKTYTLVSSEFFED